MYGDVSVCVWGGGVSVCVWGCQCVWGVYGGGGVSVCVWGRGVSVCGGEGVSVCVWGCVNVCMGDASVVGGGGHIHYMWIIWTL